MLADDLKKAAQELAEHRQRLLAVHRLLFVAPGVELHHAVQIVASDVHATARLLEGSTAQLAFAIPNKKEKP